VKRLEFQPKATQKPPIMARFIEEPLSEVEILDIQDVFLTNGIHTLHVPTVSAGRRLINTFLHSLDCYYTPACLTGAVEPLHSTVYDLYADVTRYALGMAHGGDLEEFFIERFYVDFLWIEQSEVLKKTTWYAEFEQRLIDLKIDQHIPIICLKYRDKISF